MIIYEVNLTINNKIFDGYIKWLREHMTEMLNFDGFKKADLGIVVSEDSNSSQTVRVAYYVESQKMLDEYLEKHAAKMREEAKTKFGAQFSASRRVILDITHAHHTL